MGEQENVLVQIAEIKVIDAFGLAKEKIALLIFTDPPLDKHELAYRQGYEQGVQDMYQFAIGRRENERQSNGSRLG